MDPVATLRVALPSGQPVEVHLLAASPDAVLALLRAQDPQELERAALARDDFDDQTAAGFTAALLLELQERAVADV
jgi:hypothetical protein